MKNALVSGDRISPYYMPGIKNILRVAKEFPMWSNLMNTYFKSPYINATSTPVESDFCELKKRILMHESKPIKVDKFTVTHMNNIESRLKMARSIQNQDSTCADGEKLRFVQFI